MHTIVVISNNPSIDMNMLNSMENLFPECRIEVIDASEWQNLKRSFRDQKGAHVQLKPFQKN